MIRGQQITQRLGLSRALAVAMGVLVGALTAADRLAAFASVAVLGLGVALAAPLNSLFFGFVAVAFIDVSPITIHGTYLRLYQVLAPILILRWALTRPHLTRNRVFVGLGLWWLAYWPAYGRVIDHAAFWTVVLGEAFLIVVTYFVYQFLTARSAAFRIAAFRMLIWGAIIVVLSGLIQVALPIHGLHEQMAGGILRPSGFMREADWYGTVCTYAALVLIWVLLFEKYNVVSRSVARIALSMAIVGDLLSLSRASWLGLAVGGAGLLWWWRRDRHNPILARLVLAFSLVCLLGLAVTLMFPSVSLHFWARINPATALSASSSAGYSHLYAVELMWSLIRRHVLTGWGAGQMAYFSRDAFYRQLFAGGGAINTGDSSANFVLNQWFESGLVGLMLMAGWMTAIFKTPTVAEGTILKIVLVALLINFLLSNGINFGFVWITIAFILSFSSPSPGVARTQF